MKTESRNNIIVGVVTAAIVGAGGWVVSTLMKADKVPQQIQDLQEESDNNRDSINELIKLHLKK